MRPAVLLRRFGGQPAGHDLKVDTPLAQAGKVHVPGRVAKAEIRTVHHPEGGVAVQIDNEGVTVHSFGSAVDAGGKSDNRH